MCSGYRGIADHFSEQPLCLRSDYGSTHTELYTDIARKCVQNHSTLDVLNSAGAYQTGTSKSLRFPSWLPHWNGKLRFQPFLGVSGSVVGLFPTDSAE